MQLNHLILFNLLFTGIYSQVDPNFCNVDNLATTPIPDMSKANQFYSVIEKSSQGITEEISEFYDSVNNVGVAFQTVAGVTVGTYYNYSINELLLVKDFMCRVLPLNEAYKEGPFFFIVDKDGKERITTAFGLLIYGKLKVGYLGSSNVVRGIPVKVWQTCFYDKERNASVKVTMSFSNDSWILSEPQPDFPNIPVQIVNEYKFADATKTNSIEYYSVIKFNTKKFESTQFEYTRSGVYCPGRADFHQSPSLPQAFSFIAHQAAGLANSDALLGTLDVFRVSVDYDKKLFRLDTIEKSDHITYIDDQNTGLRYQINRYANKECNVFIFNSANATEGISPAELFSLDANPPPQFSGQKKIRTINTDVWIAPRTYKGSSNYVFDWHFMATGWAVQETNDVKFNEPIAILMSKISNSKIIQQTTFLISDFDQTRPDLTEFDISNCEDIKSKKLQFTITQHPDYEIIKNNRGEFMNGAIESINMRTSIPIIRITRLKTYFTINTIYVWFTLLEKSNLNGNPSFSSISLKDAYQLLNDGISSGTFAVSYSLRPDKFTIKNYTAVVDKASLTTISF